MLSIHKCSIYIYILCFLNMSNIYFFTISHFFASFPMKSFQFAIILKFTEISQRFSPLFLTLHVQLQTMLPFFIIRKLHYFWFYFWLKIHSSKWNFHLSLGLNKTSSPYTFSYRSPSFSLFKHSGD